ncbi:MAG: hypothetical protein A2Z74_02700 [Chloroflexi bacterium RBG_13_46_9]|nr:MAG: hypothetical protein A2Z74_02700 [Chloroflexi bacterium RBG_13_46_9]
MASKRLICQIDFSSLIPFSFEASPDKQRVAYIAHEGDGQFVVIDGEEGEKYDEVVYLTFSPDSRRVAYLAQEGDKWFVVVNGEEGKKYDDASSPIFSPDSQRLAYVAEAGDKWFVVIDGEEGKKYDKVDYPMFSPDSQRVAYAAQVRPSRKTFSWAIVVHEEEDQSWYGYYREAATPIFSPNSQRLAFWANNTFNWDDFFLVVDGEESKRYAPDEGIDCISEMGCRFSPDSQHIAFIATIGDKAVVVIDGEEGEKYDEVDYPIFSPDSQRVAYSGKMGERWCVIADGKEGNQYDEVYDLTFSPDSQLIAYRAIRGDKECVVIDGNEGEKYDCGDIKWGRGGVIFDSLNGSDCLRYIAVRGNCVYSVLEIIK